MKTARYTERNKNKSLWIENLKIIAGGFGLATLVILAAVYALA